MLSLLRDNYKGLENIFECLKTFKNILEPFSLLFTIFAKFFLVMTKQSSQFLN